MFSSVHAMSSNGLKLLQFAQDQIELICLTKQFYLCVSLNYCGTPTLTQAADRVSRRCVVVVLLAAAVAPQEGVPGGGVHRRRRREGDPQEQLRGAQGEEGMEGISNILSDILLKEVLPQKRLI